MSPARRVTAGECGDLMAERCAKVPDVQELQQQVDRLEKRMAEIEAEMADMKAAWTVYMHLMADHLHRRNETNE